MQLAGHFLFLGLCGCKLTETYETLSKRQVQSHFNLPQTLSGCIDLLPCDVHVALPLSKTAGEFFFDGEFAFWFDRLLLLFLSD